MQRLCQCTGFQLREVRGLLEKQSVFQKETVHAFPKSKTNTLTITAWPRWLRPKGEEVPGNRKRPPLPGAGKAPRPGGPVPAARPAVFAQQQGSQSLFKMHLGAGCWVLGGATSVRAPGWDGPACLRGVECRGAGWQRAGSEEPPWSRRRDGGWHSCPKGDGKRQIGKDAEGEATGLTVVGRKVVSGAMGGWTVLPEVRRQKPLWPRSLQCGLRHPTDDSRPAAPRHCQAGFLLEGPPTLRVVCVGGVIELKVPKGVSWEISRVYARRFGSWPHTGDHVGLKKGGEFVLAVKREFIPVGNA